MDGKRVRQMHIENVLNQGKSTVVIINENDKILLYDKKTDMLISENAVINEIANALKLYKPMRFITSNIEIANIIKRSNLFVEHQSVYMFASGKKTIKKNEAIEFKTDMMNYEKNFVVENYKSLDREDIMKNIADGKVFLALKDNDIMGFICLDSPGRIGKVYGKEDDIIKDIVESFATIVVNKKPIVYTQVDANNAFLKEIYIHAGFDISDVALEYFYNKDL